VASRPIPAEKKNTGMMEMMLGCVAAAFLFVAAVWLTIQAFPVARVSESVFVLCRSDASSLYAGVPKRPRADAIEYLAYAVLVVSVMACTYLAVNLF